jgi:hypothetical protein
MAKLFHGTSTLWQADNSELAHIQVATHRVLSAGQGFFVTVWVGNVEMRSHWVGSSADLTFTYDLYDDEGEGIPAVTINPDTVDFWEAQLLQPLGLAYGNTLDMPVVPFLMQTGN